VCLSLNLHRAPREEPDPRDNVYNYGRMQEVWLDRSRAVFGSGPTARRTGDTAGAGGGAR